MNKLLRRGKALSVGWIFLVFLGLVACGSAATPEPTSRPTQAPSITQSQGDTVAQSTPVLPANTPTPSNTSQATTPIAAIQLPTLSPTSTQEPTAAASVNASNSICVAELGTESLEGASDGVLQEVLGALGEIDSSSGLNKYGYFDPFEQVRIVLGMADPSMGIKTASPVPTSLAEARELGWSASKTDAHTYVFRFPTQRPVSVPGFVYIYEASIWKNSPSDQWRLDYFKIIDRKPLRQTDGLDEEAIAALQTYVGNIQRAMTNAPDFRVPSSLAEMREAGWEFGQATESQYSVLVPVQTRDNNGVWRFMNLQFQLEKRRDALRDKDVWSAGGGGTGPSGFGGSQVIPVEEISDSALFGLTAGLQDRFGATCYPNGPEDLREANLPFYGAYVVVPVQVNDTTVQDWIVTLSSGTGETWQVSFENIYRIRVVEP